MSDRELLVQLEKASISLTKLKTANADLRRRVKELEARNNAPNVNEAPSDSSKLAATSADKLEIVELRERLAVAETAALHNLAYAQELWQRLEDIPHGLSDAERTVDP